MFRTPRQGYGRDRLDRLINERWPERKADDWLGEISADCPKKIAHNMNDPCGSRCPELARVL